VRVAETDPRISILARELDNYPELINTPTGGYAVSAPDGFLMIGRDSAHPTEIADMRRS
jgi:hypothetical protein